MSVTMAVTLLSHHQPSIQEDNATQESTVQPMWNITKTTTMVEALVADDSKTLITGEIINQDKILQTTCQGQVT